MSGQKTVDQAIAFGLEYGSNFAEGEDVKAI